MIQYVLDSDHLSLYQRGYEPLKAYFTIIPPENIAITIISVEELYSNLNQTYGFLPDKCRKYHEFQIAQSIERPIF